ncbi:Uncharacterised protein [BD1-7 clade bacterium]|uniref:Uncharacterized protein n=1 Tax=BD1-7 clade bacterium TaxID=2029982 RepID=A0A5S9P5Y6_9GAMM|nr:Uncharacterised protein [BD1-7 clade bacterium]
MRIGCAIMSTTVSATTLPHVQFNCPTYAANNGVDGIDITLQRFDNSERDISVAMMAIEGRPSNAVQP